MEGLRLPQGGGFWNKAKSHQDSAIGAYSRQEPGRKTEIEAPGKTGGGLLGAAAGMGLAGASIGGAPGAAIGAGIGALTYFLS